MTATNSAIENNRVAICIIVNDDCNESFTCEWDLPDEIGEVEVGSILEVETNLGTAEALFLMEKNSQSDPQRKKVLKKTCKKQDHWCWSKSLVEKFRDEVSSGESLIEEYPWIADETFVADCTVRNNVRLAYCVHVDHESDRRISRIYSWEMPDDMGAPKFGDTLIVENLNGAANVVFLFEREVIPIEPLRRKKVLGISNLEIYLYMEDYHLLFDISNEILRGTHTPDDFLGVEDGVFIGWRTPVEEQKIDP